MHMIKRTLRTLALLVLLVLVDVSGVKGDELPDSAYITGVNGHPQKHQLSCESRSAADLAAYWGISLGENEFLGVLPRADNPEKGFVGSPDAPWGNIPPHGYGVHAGPVASTLRAFGLQAEAHNHLKWDDLRREINAGRPVIVWIIGAMWNGRALEYSAPDGSTSIVAAYEHTMILTGYSKDTVQVVDAYTGQYQAYTLASFLSSWSVLGNMAVFASSAPPSPPAAPTESNPLTYTVQPGDYLKLLAGRYGTTWQQLAEINSIPFPFDITAGQVLKLPEGSTLVAEPETTPPDLQEKVVNYKVRLPLVLKDSAVQGDPISSISSASPSVTQLISFVDLQSTAAYCSETAVGKTDFEPIRNKLVPASVSSEVFLRK
jgi:uncharacterized protein YvpB